MHYLATVVVLADQVASEMKPFVVGVAFLVFLAGAVLGLACQRPGPAAPVPDAPAWFEDVTEKVGLDFVHDAGPVGDFFMPQQVGSGAALFDFNNDGLLDILLLQNGGPGGAKNRLYKQTADHRFVDA